MISAIRNKRAAISEISLYVGAYIVYLATKGLIHSDTRVVGLGNG